MVKVKITVSIGGLAVAVALALLALAFCLWVLNPTESQSYIERYVTPALIVLLVIICLITVANVCFILWFSYKLASRFL